MSEEEEILGYFFCFYKGIYRVFRFGGICFFVVGFWFRFKGCFFRERDLKDSFVSGSVGWRVRKFVCIFLVRL